MMKNYFVGMICAAGLAVCSGCTVLAVADAVVSTAVTATSAVVHTGIKATEAVVDAVIPSKK
jgi:hypothetical protein